MRVQEAARYIAAACSCAVLMGCQGMYLHDASRAGVAASAKKTFAAAESWESPKSSKPPGSAVGGEFVFMQPSGFETDRGNATARHIDRGWRGRVTVPRRVSLA